VSSGQSGNLDNTNIQSVQQKLLDEVENLTAKRDRLIEDGDYGRAGAVDGQIKELEAQFDNLPPMSPAGEKCRHEAMQPLSLSQLFLSVPRSWRLIQDSSENTKNNSAFSRKSLMVRKKKWSG